MQITVHLTTNILVLLVTKQNSVQPLLRGKRVQHAITRLELRSASTGWSSMHGLQNYMLSKCDCAFAVLVFVSKLLPSMPVSRFQVVRPDRFCAGRENIGEPKLISAGRTLKDDCMPLSAVGVSGTSKILVLAGSDAVQSRAVSSQAEQAARLDRLKAAVDAMASRDHP